MGDSRDESRPLYRPSPTDYRLLVRDRGAIPVYGERGENDQEDQREADRGGDRGGERPGAAGVGRAGGAEEFAAGGDGGAERSPGGDGPQHHRHSLGRHEGVGEEGEREEGDEADALRRLSGADNQPDEGADPDHREAEEEQDAEARQHLPQSLMRAPADDQAADRHHGDAEDTVGQV